MRKELIFKHMYSILKTIYKNIVKFLKICGLYSIAVRFVRMYWNVFNRFKWSYIDLSVVLWPPAKELFDEIEKDIQKKYDVHSVKEFIIRNDSLENFIVETYKIDRASKRKIEAKLDRLMQPPHIFRLIDIRIPRPKMICHSNDNSWVRCKEVNQLKMKIRNKYKSKMLNYIYDIIIHSTEVTTHNEQLLKLIERYKETPIKMIR